MLGSALCRALVRTGTELFKPAQPFKWESIAEFEIQAAAAVEAFADRSTDTGRWEIYWAAGISHMGSSAADLARETQALATLLRLLGSESRLNLSSGAIAFASSAGAIYGGSPAGIINENAAVAPTTAYGREKLVQEDLLRSFVASNSATALLARLSTVYGPGQSTGKPQGLLTHIARCMLGNRPVQIYVPLDTIRDYISSDDAALVMVNALHGMRKTPHALTMIVASERPTTIAEVVATFRKIGRRAPRVVTSAAKLSPVYPRTVQFRSLAIPENARASTTSLTVGIAQLMVSERAAFVRSSIPSRV